MEIVKISFGRLWNSLKNVVLVIEDISLENRNTTIELAL